jgi:transketolase
VVTSTQELARRARAIRYHVLTMVRALGHGYVGQGLGVADVMAVLFFHELQGRFCDPTDPRRDRFLLSVGHYAVAVYAALHEAGLYTREEILSYGQDGSPVEQNATEFARGFETTGGSLGQGLSQAVGMALGSRVTGLGYRVFVLASDGEVQEGQFWEAVQVGAHYGLDNLVAVIDVNGLQADGPTALVTDIEPLQDKLAAFGWHTQRVDGHDVPSLVQALAQTRVRQGKPHALVCDTVPGKGVPSLEQAEKTHYVRPRDPGVWDVYLKEFEEGGGTVWR